jgi:hypothetical protein
MKLKPSAGVTFRVHDVEAVRTQLETCKTRDSIQWILENVEKRYDSPVLSCSDYNSNVLSKIEYNALVGAVHIAFAEHRPLTLSPDAIWIAILQGLAQHVHIHSEKLRPLLVSHKGRKDLKIVLRDFNADSPESAWDRVIEEFAAALSAEVGERSAALVSDFSTTGFVEKLVSQVCILDVFEPFFEYVLYSGCGIPEITLTGTHNDWQKLRLKIELLENFQIDWWLPHLREISQHFCRASKGDVEIEFWQDIYKQRDRYGASVVNGWIIKLIPYVQNGMTGNWDVINPVFEDSDDGEDAESNARSFGGASTNELPSGMSVVPFRCFDEQKVERQMEMIGGFVGVEQDETTFAVRPKLGWAVRKMKASGWEFLDSHSSEKAPPLASEKLSEVVMKMLRAEGFALEFCGDFFGLYKYCNGVTRRSDERIDWLGWNIRPLEQTEFIEPRLVYKWNCEDEGRVHEEPAEGPDLIRVNTDNYLRFFDATDGSYAVLKMARSKGAQYEVLIIQPDGKRSAVFAGLLNFVTYLTEDQRFGGKL